MYEDIVKIIIPVIVAVVPSLFLLLSKKFEHAEKSREKIYDMLRDLRDRMGKTEGDIQNIRGRLNGMAH